MKKTHTMIMIGSTIVEMLFVIIMIMFDKTALVGGKTIFSFLIVVGYAIPSFLYSKIAGNQKYGNIAIFGSIFAGITAILTLFYVWGIIKSGYYFIDLVTILNIVMWYTALISPILAYPSNDRILRALKVISVILLSITSMLCIAMVSFNIKYILYLNKLHLILAILDIGFYLSTVIYAKNVKKNM